MIDPRIIGNAEGSERQKRADRAAALEELVRLSEEDGSYDATLLPPTPETWREVRRQVARDRRVRAVVLELQVLEASSGTAQVGEAYGRAAGLVASLLEPGARSE